jgi:hypothetical protein
MVNPRGKIREFNQLASKFTVNSQSPESLEDHAIKLASIVLSHLAFDMSKLNGLVPETFMLGQTADIAIIFSVAWYIGIIIMNKTLDLKNQR